MSLPIADRPPRPVLPPHIPPGGGPGRASTADATPLPSPGPTPTPVPTPQPRPTETSGPTPTPSPSPGPAPLPPLSTQAERDADKAAREALKNDPDALKAYEDLLKSDQFQRSDGGYPGDPPGVNGRTRVSIMKQIAAAPEKAVVDNLRQMSDRSWFRDMGVEDRQRATKVVAHLSSSKTPGAAGNDTRRNTVESFVSNDEPPLKFEDLHKDENSVLWGQRSSRSFLWFQSSEITLNRKLISADDNPISYGTDESKLALDTLAHELNHERRDGKNEATHDYYMNEYRAWYAGQVSENGSPPSAREAFARTRELLMMDLYPNLRDGFNNPGPEQDKMVAFVAEMVGLDPAKTTAQDLKQLSISTVPAGAAPVPVSTSSDDPNNIDNRP